MSTDPVKSRNYAREREGRVFGEVEILGKTLRKSVDVLRVEGVRILRLFAPSAETVARAEPVARSLGLSVEYLSDLEFLAVVVEYGAPHRDHTKHGSAHWQAVAATALDLADETPDADRVVCLLFGLLHDSRRDLHGPEHARAAAQYARQTLPRVLELAPDRARTLYGAIARHAEGETSDDPTIGACWDSDRLHLPRNKTKVIEALLSTDAAKGPGQLERAARWRDAPPSWKELVGRL